MLRRLAIAAVACMTISCGVKPIGAVVADTPRAEWHEGESVELCYSNSDTLGIYNLGVVARQEAGSVASALPLRIAVQAPSGLCFEGAAVLSPTERHKGGSFVELSAGWIEGARLGEVGDYTFTLTPQQTTSGVWTAGVTVQRVMSK